MSLYSVFKTDHSKEREGRWFELVGIKNEDGTEPGFKMARMSRANPEYQAAIERLSKDIKQAVDLDTLTEDVAGPIMRGVFVETILLDWRNVYDENGQAIPYSKEAALKLFTELPDLYLVLVDEASKLSNFRARELDEVAKKSSARSRKPLGTEST